MPTGRNRTDDFDAVFRCPSCQGQHRAQGTMELRRQPIVFGGGTGTSQTEAPWAGPATCPRTEDQVECHLFVRVQDGEYVHRLTIDTVADEASAATPPAALSGPDVPSSPATTSSGRGVTPAPTAVPAVPDDWMSAELAEWRNTSVATSRTFSTTMLTSSSAAVAVYFSVLKYLGHETTSGSWGWVTVVPALLFLVAAALYALALFPALAFVRVEEYAEFRARRITLIHRRMTIGTLCYLAAVLLSLVVFFGALR